VAKPKAPRWLTEAFADGVVDLVRQDHFDLLPDRRPPCFLSYFDPDRRGCEGEFERFHFIGRQRVEHALGVLMPAAGERCPWCSGRGCDPGNVLADCPTCGGSCVTAPVDFDSTPLILVAAWDPRNGGIGCEQHHRRFDDHQVSLPRNRIVIPLSALPGRVVAFAGDYGLESELERKFR
jgi:hypothetical protein